MSKATRAMEEAVQTLRYGSARSHQRAAETLRELSKGNGPIVAIYELLLHLTGEYEKVHTNDTTEIELLSGELADRAEESKHKALALYAKGLAIFANGGLAKQVEVGVRSPERSHKLRQWARFSEGRRERVAGWKARQDGVLRSGPKQRHERSSTRGVRAARR